MNILSLFDGMSSGQIALNRIGIKYDNYYASEIDKYAIKVTQANYPNTIQLGSIASIKVKTLYLSEVYSYLCTHDTDLQSKISEQEVLYWLDQKFTISTDFRTQKQNEGQSLQQPSFLQCFEKIRIGKCGVGNFIKTQNARRSGIDGDRANIKNSFNLQCSEWRYGNDIYTGNTQTNITGTTRKAENGDLQTENICNFKRKISRRKEKEVDFRENEKSYVDKRSKKELPRRSEEDKLNRKVEEEKVNGGIEANEAIENLIRKLQTWDEVNGTSENYRNFIRLHSQEQITVVEYSDGLKIFKGRIDLLFGGSPCQGFSFAGKGLNFEDPRSKLFFEYVRLLRETKPKYFLLENVKMKKEHEQVISEYLGCRPIRINSALVSAQNRQRLYWTNIPVNAMPKDRGIVLSDVLDIDYDFDIYLKKGKKVRSNKAQCLTGSSGHSCGNHSETSVIVPKLEGYPIIKPNGRVELFSSPMQRRFSEIECERLQTVPADFTNHVSSSQRYRLLSNGWTVDVIAFIFGFMPVHLE